MPNKISVLLVDDHALVRRGFRRILEDEADITVVGEAGDGAEAVRLTKQLKPTVVVMDCALPGTSGLAATRKILETHPEQAILMLSMHSEETLVRQALEDKPKDLVISMHLCRGNFRSTFVASGGYEPIAELIFNEIKMDGYFLEYDSARAGGFEPLRFLPKGKVAILGLVTTKSAKLESKDELKRRLDEASKHAPLEQLALSPQCGFSSGIGGNTMDEEVELAKLRLVVETAREVWGSA